MDKEFEEFLNELFDSADNNQGNNTNSRTEKQNTLVAHENNMSQSANDITSQSCNAWADTDDIPLDQVLSNFFDHSDKEKGNNTESMTEIQTNDTIVAQQYSVLQPSNITVNVVPLQNEENEQLQKENKKLKKENEKLKAENASLLKQIKFWKSKSDNRKQSAQCKYCQKLYRNKNSLQSHISKKHSGAGNTEEKLFCEKCSNQIPKSNFSKHFNKCA